MSMREQIPQNDSMEEMKQEEHLPFFASQRGKGLSLLLLFVIVAVVMVYQFSGTSGAVTYEMDDRMLGVVCKDYPAVLIAYSDIAEIATVDTFDMGNPVDTTEWDSGWCGTFENQEYGVYTLFAYTGTGEYIVIRYSEGVLVFNLKSRGKTNAVYEALEEHCNATGVGEEV